MNIALEPMTAYSAAKWGFLVPGGGRSGKVWTGCETVSWRGAVRPDDLWREGLASGRSAATSSAALS
jgi:hypothetical protein